MDTRRRKRRLTYTVGRRPADPTCVGGVNCLLSLPQSPGDASGIVASGGRDGVVRLWQKSHSAAAPGDGGDDRRDLRQPDLVACCDEHLDWVNDLCYAPTDGGNFIASCSSDSQVKLWSVPPARPAARADSDANDESKKPVAPVPVGATSELTLTAHADYVKRITWASEQQRLISGSFDGTVWGADIRVALSQPQGGDFRGVYALAARESLVAVGTTSPSIKVIDWRSARLASRLWGHKDLVRDLQWIETESGAAALLASASSDGSWRLWDERVDRPLATFQVHRSGVWCLDHHQPLLPSPGSPLWVLSGGKEGCVMLTALPFATGDAVQYLSTPQGTPLQQSLVPPGSERRNAPQSSLLLSLPAEGGERESVTALACSASPDGRSSPLLWVASSSAVTPLSVWDTQPAFAALPRLLSQPPSSGSGQGAARARSARPHDEGDACQLEVHSLTASVVERNCYSLLQLQRPTSPPQDPSQSQSFASERPFLGCAIADPLVCCPATPPIVRAQVLENRRHCLTRDADGRVRLWDITTASLAADYGRCDFDEKMESFARSQKVSLQAWSSVDISTGSLTVVLDYPSALQCDTTLWEKDAHSPLLPVPPSSLSLSHNALLMAGQEPPVNLGESVLRGLFTHAQVSDGGYRVLIDTGTLSMDSAERRKWLQDQRMAKHNSKAHRSEDKVQFEFPDDCRLAVWSYRFNPVCGPLPQSARRNDPPTLEVGEVILRQAEAQPYQPHTSTVVGAAACLTGKDPQRGGRGRVLSTLVPTWIRDVLERGEFGPGLPERGQVSFQLKPLHPDDLPPIPRNPGDRLKGRRTLRVCVVCRQLVDWLDIRTLPTVQEWEEGARPEEVDLENLEVGVDGKYQARDSKGKWWDVTIRERKENWTYSVHVHDGTVQKDGFVGRIWESVHSTYFRAKPPERVLAEEYIQLLSYDNRVLDPLCSLSTVDRHYRERGKELTVFYRKARAGPRAASAAAAANP
eukprot:TRINITY_DN1241_c7_g1_i1.p1 TRINITY_DN1241_c7_g1~~TRINITY_DN1241_c7_g1_i1.p1  ORF type:complete len:980 (+),score=225.62 TRINITY_DN1241_c7_g1_i1:54-2993(+)